MPFDTLLSVGAAQWGRAIVGTALLMAAASKAANGGPFRAALQWLGIHSSSSIRRVEWIVILAEALLGLWIISAWAPRASAFVASLALALLTLVLLRLKLRGYLGSCGCLGFNQIGIGYGAFLRNLVLFGIAVSLSAFEPSQQGTSSLLSIGSLPILVAIIATTAFAAITSRDRNPTLDGKTDSIAAAEIAREMNAVDLAGAPIVVGRSQLNAQLVVFAKGRCPGCRRDRDVLNNLVEWPPQLEAVIVCGGNIEETHEFSAEVKSHVRVVADPQWQIAIAWGVSTTPYAVLLNGDGHIRRRGQLLAALNTIVEPTALQ